MIDWSGYELILGIVDRSAVRPGAAVRHGRPARRAVQGPCARPAAADHDAGPPDDGADEDPPGARRHPRPGRRWTSPSSSSCSCGSASSWSSSAGSRRSTSTRSWRRPSGSSPSTPASCSTTPTSRRGACRGSPSARTRASTSPTGRATARRFHLRPIRPEDEPLVVEFHRSLSPETVYQRYLRMLGLDAADRPRAAHPDLLPRLRPRARARRRTRGGRRTTRDRRDRPAEQGSRCGRRANSRCWSATHGRVMASAASCCERIIAVARGRGPRTPERRHRRRRTRA